MDQIWYTATLAVETPNGTRWQGVSYAAHGLSRTPRRAINGTGERLPRGSEVTYRSPLRRSANDAHELARSRTIHHNVFHDGEWPEAAANHKGIRCAEGQPLA